MTTNPSHDPRRGGRQRKRGAGIGSWIWLFAWVLFTFWVEAALIRVDQAHIIGPSTICERVNLALQQGRCSFDAKLSWSLLDGQVRISPSELPEAPAFALTSAEIAEFTYAYRPEDSHFLGGTTGALLVALVIVLIGLLPSIRSYASWRRTA